MRIFFYSDDDHVLSDIISDQSQCSVHHYGYYQLEVYCGGLRRNIRSGPHICIYPVGDPYRRCGTNQFDRIDDVNIQTLGQRRVFVFHDEEN